MDCRGSVPVLAAFLMAALFCTCVKSVAAHGPAPTVETMSVDEASPSYWYLNQPWAISASFDLGTDPDDGLRLGVRKRVFDPDDTIFVSIATEVEDGQNAPAIIEALFTYDFEGEEMVVSHESRDLDLSAKGITNFQISKPDGFPEGTYYVEVRVNRVVIGKTNFKVSR